MENHRKNPQLKKPAKVDMSIDEEADKSPNEEADKSPNEEESDEKTRINTFREDFKTFLDENENNDWFNNEVEGKGHFKEGKPFPNRTITNKKSISEHTKNYLKYDF